MAPIFPGKTGSDVTYFRISVFAMARVAAVVIWVGAAFQMDRYWKEVIQVITYKNDIKVQYLYDIQAISHASDDLNYGPLKCQNTLFKSPLQFLGRHTKACVT